MTYAEVERPFIATELTRAEIALDLSRIEPGGPIRNVAPRGKKPIYYLNSTEGFNGQPATPVRVMQSRTVDNMQLVIAQGLHAGLGLPLDNGNTLIHRQLETVTIDTDQGPNTAAKWITKRLRSDAEYRAIQDRMSAIKTREQRPPVTIFKR